MAFSVQECTLSRSNNTGLDGIRAHTALRKEPDFWRAASVPDAWWRRRQWAPSGSKHGNYKHGRYTQGVAATRRWLREATQLLRKTK
jgi:hypothetical protein